MHQNFNFREYPLANVLDRLLEDKTTGKNIIWATNSYREFGEQYCDRFEMTAAALLGLNPILIQPRAFKSLEAQQERTKKKAEVFTPTWIVNKMVSHIDEEWFGRKGVFNIEGDTSWQTVNEPVNFGKKSWKKYVGETVLEITCGEAPFIVSRYNAADGEPISIKDRVGVLDRKLRIINENTQSEEEWYIETVKAFKRVYGYEYQGDNLLIGRINLLMTFVEYYEDKWKKQPTQKQLNEIANIISWNFWQMDGLSGTVPLGVPQAENEQLTLFSFDDEPEEKAPLCKVRKWRAKKTILYKEIEKKEGIDMGNKKWDIVIGNPPYQEEQISEDTGESRKNFSPPVYNLFMEESNKIAEQVLLIHPARFLFNAGSTPKKWNEKMLDNPHFSVLDYEPDSNKIFPGLVTPIKGGIAITYHNVNRIIGPIRAFSPYSEVNSISKKVSDRKDFISFMDSVYSRTEYRFTPRMHEAFPNALSKLSDGHAYDVSSNIFTRIPEVFLDEIPQDDQRQYIRILGRSNNRRVYKYILSDYINPTNNLECYKLFVPQAMGSGNFGEALSPSVIGIPFDAHTETFISIGDFSTESEASNAAKYLKTQFLRTLLGVLKVTQNGNKPVWKMIPLQDFTSNSDIDWSKSISDIDQQLYRKYNLSQDEIGFIESHVKEME